MSRTVYVNGDFVAEEDAKISVFDSGYLVGDGIWEAVRLHDGVICFLDAHLDRYEEIIRGAAELVKAHRRNGASRTEIVDAFTAWNLARARREGIDSAKWQRYENVNPSDMCADGVSLFWQRQDSA